MGFAFQFRSFGQMIKLRHQKTSGIETDDRLMIEAFPGYARKLASGDWKFSLSGAVCQPPESFNMRQRMMIRMLGNAMQATPEQLQCDMFQARVAPFLAEAEHKRHLIVTIGDQSFQLSRRTYRNGHFRGTVGVSQALVDSIRATSSGHKEVPYRVELADQPAVVAEGIVRLISDGGLSVISDIDDTIKVSGVGNRKELLANTFLREFKSVTGMAELYQQWDALGASFHYVSSSPWQLYRALQGLHTELRFPAGTMHLRNFRLRDQLFKKFRIRRHGKVSAIQSLLKGLPGQKFVLIGDSGEKDPEIYRRICRRFPGRVIGLFIRDLPHRRMTDERLLKLRKALPDGICERYENAEELQDTAADLFSKSAT